MENVSGETATKEIDRLGQRTRELEQANELRRREVEEQRLTIQMLRQPGLDLRRIVDSIPVPVAVTTPPGEVEALNQATLDYFGGTLEEIKGWSASDALHPNDLERTVAAQRAVIAARSCDVTDNRVTAKSLDKVRSELTHAARATSLGVLAASIAHEINQPPAGIITNANTCLRMLAADSPNVDGARETARRTIRDGNRASEIVSHLRSLFSKKTEKSAIVDLNDAAIEVIALAANDLRRNRVILRTDLTLGLPLLNADRVQLQQVILKLLLNASDAMNDVEDRRRRMTIRTAFEENDVRLSVQDCGIGFADEDAERLFQAFYTTKSSGMGIGLSVSRSIIEGHNGRLWAKRNPGLGATFSFSIPANPQEQRATA